MIYRFRVLIFCCIFTSFCFQSYAKKKDAIDGHPQAQQLTFEVFEKILNDVCKNTEKKEQDKNQQHAFSSDELDSYIHVFQEIFKQELDENAQAHFEKLFSLWGTNSPNKKELTVDDIGKFFPALKNHAQTVVAIFKQYKKNIGKNGTYVYYRLPFVMCACPLVRLSLRLYLILMQLNYFVAHYKPTDRIVHTAFAEGGLLQTWLLINALTRLGYKNLHINVIGPELFEAGAGIERTVRQIVANFKHYLFDSRSITVKAYRYGYEYVQDVMALKSHSFDIVDPGSVSSKEVFYKSAKPEDFKHCSKMIVIKHEYQFVGGTKISEEKYSLVSFQLFNRLDGVEVLCNFEDNVAEKNIGDLDVFMDKLRQQHFKTRKEAMDWIVSAHLLKKFIVRTPRIYLHTNKNGCSFKLSHSCDSDFEEMVNEKKSERAVCWDLNNNKLIFSQLYEE